VTSASSATSCSARWTHPCEPGRPHRRARTTPSTCSPGPRVASKASRSSGCATGAGPRPPTWCPSSARTAAHTPTPSCPTCGAAGCCSTSRAALHHLRTAGRGSATSAPLTTTSSRSSRCLWPTRGRACHP
jgi:hypothetical protein